MSDSLRPHGLQQARPLFPLPSPRVHPSSCPLNQWCHSSSTTLFFFCLQSFQASGSFPMRRLFVSGGQSVGASASASVLPINIQDWFPLGLMSLFSLLSKGLSSLLQHHYLNASILWHSAFFMIQFLHLYVITGKTLALTIQTFVSKEMSLLFLKNFIYFLLAALGLCCCMQALSNCGEWWLLFVAVLGLLLAVASLVAEHGLYLGLAGSVVVAHRLSCPVARGVFLLQGLNLCPLHWQVEFLTTGPPGKSCLCFLICCLVCHNLLSKNQDSSSKQEPYQEYNCTSSKCPQQNVENWIMAKNSVPINFFPIWPYVAALWFSILKIHSLICSISIYWYQSSPVILSVDKLYSSWSSHYIFPSSYVETRPG